MGMHLDLDDAGHNAPPRAAQPNRPAPSGGSSGFDDMDDDIPFASASPARDVILKGLEWRVSRET